MLKIGLVPVPDDGVPPPVPPWPLPPLVLDKISVPATNAYSCFRRLRRNYNGYAFRVRRTVPDSATKDIGFVGDYVDTAALLAFVGTGAGYITLFYDQSGNGRDLPNANTSTQPRIANAGTPDVYPAGGRAMAFDGSNDQLRRAVSGNTIGMSGNPNITVGIAFQGSGSSKLFFNFGRNGGNTATGYALSRTSTGLTNPYLTYYGTRKYFVPLLNADTDGRYYVALHAAGANTHSDTLRENGVALAPASYTGSALPLALLDQNLELGGSVNFASSYAAAKINVFMLFNAVLAGSNLAAFEAELATHIVAQPPYRIVGTPPVATYSLYRKAPAPINRAWLTVASRAVPPPLDFSEQGDPLPILFI